MSSRGGSHNHNATEIVRQLLRDGKPHHRGEITLALARAIPPELAARRKTGNKQTDDLTARVYAGFKTMGLSALRHLEERGEAVMEKNGDGKETWRYVDREYLEIAAIVREHYAAGGKAPDPI